MMIALCVLAAVNIAVTSVLFYSVRTRLVLLQDDASAIRMRTVPVDVGGRLPPSPSELQAARNRMDKLGIAHPGEPG